MKIVSVSSTNIVALGLISQDVTGFVTILAYNETSSNTDQAILFNSEMITYSNMS